MSSSCLPEGLREVFRSGLSELTGDSGLSERDGRLRLPGYGPCRSRHASSHDGQSLSAQALHSESIF